MIVEILLELDFKEDREKNEYHWILGPFKLSHLEDCDRAERHDIWSRFMLFILLFLEGKRKGKLDIQSRGQKSCLYARS